MQLLQSIFWEFVHDDTSIHITVLLMQLWVSHVIVTYTILEGLYTYIY